MATAVGDDYFDGTSPLSRVQRHFAVARRAGVKYLRCAFSWNAIEKQPGHYDWRFWDKLVDLAEENSIQLIPYVAYTPEWAARDPKDFWKQPPRDPELYADFMYTISARYRGRIRSWEVWNEPDNQDFWTGNADDFGALAQLAAKKIREADPQIVLVLGGMAYGPAEFFQRLMTKFHIDRFFDVIAMHAYPETWLNARAETVFQEWVPRMAEMIAQGHSGDELWINEMGYADYRFNNTEASVYGSNVFYRYEHTRRDQAAMLFKFQTMALATGQVELTGWYRIDDFLLKEKRLGDDLVNYHLGLVDWRGHPKPALYALRFFNELLGKPTKLLHLQISAAPSSQAVINAFLRSDNTIIVTGWLRSSQPGEVAQNSGMLVDTRFETVSVDLPCAHPKLPRYYGPLGQPERANAFLDGSTLKRMQLRGQTVFIAKISCSAKPVPDP